MNWIERADQLRLNAQSFVDGTLVNCDSPLVTKLSPRDGEILYELREGTAKSVDVAVQCARNAYADGRWSSLSVNTRKTMMFKLVDLLEQHAEELALLESLDVGKPISEALTIDVPLAISILRYNIEAADKFYGKVHQTDDRSLVVDLRRPRGVVGGIIGWNFPFVLAIMKLAPALLAGNTLVLKPSELSSLSACRVAELAREAGIPDGVFNVVVGMGSTVGNALARHMDVDLLTFTGSSATGKRIMVAAGESNMKRLLLECGGKSPNIVFDDCPDLDGVVDAVIAKMFWNQGQVCTAGSRLIVQDNIKGRLMEKLISKVSALKSADPLKPETQFGAIISHEQMAKVLSYIDCGKEQGADIVLGGNQTNVETGGYFVEATIFDNVSTDQRIAQEEIFGPVLSVLSFGNDEEAVGLANSTMYGLSATVWTQSLRRAQTMAYGLEAGEVVVKATTNPSEGPAFGSVALEGHKQSGVGAESGIEGLEAYTSSRAVHFFV